MVQTENRLNIPKDTARNNNVSFLRFLAALMVMLGHMAYLCDGYHPIFLQTGVHVLGVYILFSLSGELITLSWCNDPKPLRYTVKRFVRIFPPLIVFVLLMTFVAGPMLSRLTFKEYFQSGAFTYLRNLRLFPIYALPGVFETVPYANVVNGSLWTIPVEIAMYAIIPVVVTVSRYRISESKLLPKLLLVLFVCCVAALDLWTLTRPEPVRIVKYGTDWVSALHDMVYYCVGMLYTFPEVKKRLNLPLATVLLLALQFSTVNYTIHVIGMYLIVPYFAHSFAYGSSDFAFFGKKLEISYGIYLYGFFIQQLTVYLSMRYWGGIPSQFMCNVISISVTILVAFASAKWVEKPLIRQSKKLLNRLPF